jgi:hypothetical protein
MFYATQLRTRLLAALALPVAAIGCSGTATNRVLPDVPSGDVVAADVTAPFDTVTPTDAPVLPDTSASLCPARSARECLTQAEVENRIRTPFLGGDGPPVDGGTMPPPGDVPVAIDVPVAPNGCYVPSAVHDGCCNSAVAVEREASLCCYTFCQGACCGRPFTVEGASRTAYLIEASAWTEASTVPVVLDAETRRILARAWRDDGMMEHASIASFARFTLQLMALGAPPALVTDAQRAGLDEIDHTRRCLQIAARLDETTAGPGALDVGTSLGGLSIDDVVRAAIVEGCVGETCAALLARRRSEVATDAMVRDALVHIANDEEAHADLAWRFVAWAVSHGGDRVRAVARDTFARVLAEPVHVSDVAPGVDYATVRAYGLLPVRDARAVLTTALGEVIAPCARALNAMYQDQLLWLQQRNEPQHKNHNPSHADDHQRDLCQGDRRLAHSDA